MSCPSGFEAALNDACRITCPTDFKYIQDQGVEKCVSSQDNRYFIRLQLIPTSANLTAFVEEQSRFLTDFILLSKTIQSDQVKASEAASSPPTDDGVKAHDEVSIAYAEAIEVLKPLRPPTQPRVDIETARLSIQSLDSINLRILQICLFFVVLACLEYLLLPSSIVHGVAFFTLCVGFSAAIYLSNK